jgi:uncharacterized membrane protein (DUF373 family)
MKNKIPNLPDIKASSLNLKNYALLQRVIIGFLMFCLSLWLVGGVMSLLLHLSHATNQGWSHSAEHVIREVLIMMAILELIRTLQSYLKIGRVRVTLILDAALVVLIGELIGLWYRDYSMMEVMLSLGVITLLTLLRIVTTKFSPEAMLHEE